MPHQVQKRFDVKGIGQRTIEVLSFHMATVYLSRLHKESVTV